MRRLSYIIAALLMGCTQNPYPGVDNPNHNMGGGTVKDNAIIAYIDQRLAAEYYWLDEVEEKSESFNRNVKWNNYLGNVLGMLETNEDDGYTNNQGKRAFYSYIREVGSATRANITGFGIGLHYTIALVDSDNRHFGLLVDRVYAGSPAAEVGVKRGDVITMIDDSYINDGNYAALFYKIENNTAPSVKLTLRRQTDGKSYKVTLNSGSYDKSPVAHHEVITIEDKKIGYIVYTGFNSEYDEELIEAVRELKEDGAEEVILDLRINSGGSVNSAVTLCSALMPATFEEATLCKIVRNPKNEKMEKESYFNLKDTGSLFELDKLTVICSGYSASASELVVMGLRGLDVPVTLIGSKTEGKNCGMDVTRRTIEGVSVEFAPITFMCFNAKGFGDWGEGIEPDIDLTEEGNELSISDKNYPLPRTDWGDHQHDIALAAALAKITGKNVSDGTRSAALVDLPVAAYMDCEIEGIRLYVEE